METDQREREELGLQQPHNRGGGLLSAYGDEDTDEAVTRKNSLQHANDAYYRESHHQKYTGQVYLFLVPMPTMHTEIT